MPRNDRSDSLSVRDEDDPRRLMKAMQQEMERALLRGEADQTGGVEHQDAAERSGAGTGGHAPRHAPGAPSAGEHR